VTVASDETAKGFMMRAGPMVFWGFSCLLCAGCLSSQVASDGQNFRQALLDMYTEQAMDNLINAANSQAFVQLDYKSLIVTDTQTVKATLADESDPMSTKTFINKTGALLTAMHTYTNRLLFGGTFDSNRQMQFSSDPVSGNSDIYDCYRAFVQDSSLFCSSDEKPTGAVYLARKRCGRWYWVPLDAGPMFLQLTLKTAFMRGPDAPPPIYWSTTVDSVTPRYDKNGKPIPFKYVIAFSSEVPNDTGFVQIALASGIKQKVTLQKLDVQPYLEGQTDQTPVPVPDSVASTKILYAIHNPATVSVDQFENRPALVYSDHHPNLIAKSPDAQRLDDLLVQYRRSLKR
jgi:hypothetical protein